MSDYDRRSDPGAGRRQRQRQTTQPLFDHLEAPESPVPHRGSPTPLRDILSNVEDDMPIEDTRRQPRPTRSTEPLRRERAPEQARPTRSLPRPEAEPPAELAPRPAIKPIAPRPVPPRPAEEAAPPAPRPAPRPAAETRPNPRPTQHQTAARNTDPLAPAWLAEEDPPAPPRRRRADEQPEPRPRPTQRPQTASRTDLTTQRLRMFDIEEAGAEELRPQIRRLPDTGAMLRQVDHWQAQRGLGYPGGFEPPTILQSPLGAILISIVSIIIILGFGGGENLLRISSWLPGGASVPIMFSQVEARMPRSAGDYNLRGAPSITPSQIDTILASYNSPATGSGQAWYNLGIKYQIDPAFAIAFFIHESSAGTNPAWAGIKPDGSTTHNVGNIICAGYPTCYNRFRDYSSWEAGIEDWYRLIDVEYLKGRGHETVADIIPIYAPAFENDVQGYVRVVERMVDRWRNGEVP